MDSPCVKVCIIDPNTSVCDGCYRTLAEIARWTQFSVAERQRIMASLPARALQPTGFSTVSERRASGSTGKG
jgi:uncharacterized protein